MEVGQLLLVLLAVGLAVLVTLFVIGIVRGARVGEHVSRRDCPIDVPSDASDICYYIPAPTYPNTAYEFDIDEEAFRLWAEECGWSMSEIKGKSFIIYRYCGIGKTDSYDASMAEISHGLIYRWHEEDRGVYVAYDRAKGRAYYMSHTR